MLLEDQHAAYADKGAPEGSLRFEVEARGGWLEKAGARTVDEFDAVACARIAAERWEWSAMGTAVTGPVNAVQVLQREVLAGKVSQAVADRLLGSMVRRSFGYGQEAKTSQWRHREVIDRLGMTSEVLWSNDLNDRPRQTLGFKTPSEALAEVSR